jgi:hypothetical protein
MDDATSHVIGRRAEFRYDLQARLEVSRDRRMLLCHIEFTAMNRR